MQVLRAQRFAKDDKYHVNLDLKVLHSCCQRCMQRKGLCSSQRTKISPKLPSDLVDKNLDFQSFMIRQCPATNYGLSQIGNMDKTPMCFGMPGARTTNKKGNKTVFVRTTGHK